MTIRDREEPAAPELEPLAELARLLRLAPAGLAITAVRMRGDGPAAIVELDLSDGRMLECERAGSLFTRAGMAAWVALSTGIETHQMTKTDAERACALIRRVAAVHAELRISDLGRDHGETFLELAPLETFTLADRADRYAAFAKVKRLDPVGEAAALRTDPYSPIDAAAIARHSLVLLDRATGIRLVRVGHLFAMVRALGMVTAPLELARRMLAAGWERQGKQGAIEATSAAPQSRPILLRFWRVPVSWEELERV